jgi:glycosyltransferase involved in cell wall biosynthesis
MGALRRQLGIREDAVVAGVLGTFGQWHGVEVLAEAIRKLAVEQSDWLRRRNVHFLIVGDGGGRERVEQILSHAACGGLYSLPRLVPQDEAPKYHAATDL